MTTEIEGTFTVNGASLYTKTWKPANPPKALLVWIHGFSDHVNRYYELFPTLSSRGIEVRGFDQRGWGQSTASTGKGNAGPSSQVISEIAAFISAQLPSPVPVFVCGHSMGGAELLTLACDPQYNELTGQLAGIMTESAHIGFPEGNVPSSLTVFVGRLAGKLLPHFPLKHEIPVEKLTRDPEVMKSVKDDPLCHNTGTLEALAGVLDRAFALEKGDMRLNDNVRALWISHGNGDECTSFPGSKRFFEGQTHIADKTFKEYEGWSHQMHADLPETRPIFAKDLGDWILEHVGGEEARAKL